MADIDKKLSTSVDDCRIIDRQQGEPQLRPDGRSSGPPPPSTFTTAPTTSTSSLVAGRFLNDTPTPSSDCDVASALASQQNSDDDTRCFVGPQRPKSTPFPYAPSDRERRQHQDNVPLPPPPMSDRDASSVPTTTPAEPTREPQPILCQQHQYQRQPETEADPAPAGTAIMSLARLPTEIQEAILDHMFGFRISSKSTSGMKILPSSSLSNSTVMRHSRRRELTELALVSSTWRALVQKRLYRHIKLKGTVDVLEDAMLHLSQYPHLRPLVRHLEVWYPVFEPKYRGPVRTTRANAEAAGIAAGPATATSGGLTLPTVTTDGLTNATYILPHNKCSLQDTLQFVAVTLPEVRELTLEGGERRKAPKVVHFSHGNSIDSVPLPQLALLPSVKTLITRGQWNLARSNTDLMTLLAAFPNLTDWYASYSKPKSKSYIGMAEYLPFLPASISTLRLCLETDYRRESVVPRFFIKAAEQSHVCSSLAIAAASGRLEHLSYTGRCCHVLFDHITRLATAAAAENDGVVRHDDTRMRSIDITVKNCCRPLDRQWDSGSGIQDMGFIDAFENLVLSAIRALGVLKQVDYMRIRFVDLESVLPPLNPYFLFKNNACSGVWSGDILAEMSRVRPEARWDEISDSFGNVILNKEGRMIVSPQALGKKLTSLKLANYRMLSHRMTIH